MKNSEKTIGKLAMIIVLFVFANFAANAQTDSVICVKIDTTISRERIPQLPMKYAIDDSRLVTKCFTCKRIVTNIYLPPQANMADRSVYAILASIGGIQGDKFDNLYIRGSRSDATQIYVDGRKIPRPIVMVSKLKNPI